MVVRTVTKQRSAGLLFALDFKQQNENFNLSYVPYIRIRSDNTVFSCIFPNCIQFALLRLHSCVIWKGNSMYEPIRTGFFELIQAAVLYMYIWFINHINLYYIKYTLYLYKVKSNYNSNSNIIIAEVASIVLSNSFKKFKWRQFLFFLGAHISPHILT